MEENIRKKILDERRTIHLEYVDDHVIMQDFFVHDDKNELKETHDSFFLFSNTREKLIEIKKYNIRSITFDEDVEIDEPIQDEKIKSLIYTKSLVLKQMYLNLKERNTSIENFDSVFFKRHINYTNLAISCILGFNSIITLQDDNNLKSLKTIWEKQISIHKNDVLEVLDNEIKSSEDLNEKESLEEVKKMVEELNYQVELDEFSSAEDFFNYWPTILLPAPSYLNEIRKILIEYGPNRYIM